MSTDPERAARHDLFVHDYEAAHLPGEPPETVLTDYLVDFLHHAGARGVDVDALVERARLHFDSEPTAAGAEADTDSGAPEWDFTVRDEASGVTYSPWTDGWAIGLRCTHGDGPDAFVYLNPSCGSDDGVATVFLYVGTVGDPAFDTAVDHYVVDAAGGGR